MAGQKIFWLLCLAACGCSPMESDNPKTTALISSERQLSTTLFSQFLTSFPFFLTSPIQNLATWFWTNMIYALIWVIIAVLAFKYFTRRKVSKLRLRKRPSSSPQIVNPFLQGTPLANLEPKAVMACASCPLLIPLLQSMMGVPYSQQLLPYNYRPAPSLPIPPIPNIPFPELPVSPPTNLEDLIQDSILETELETPPLLRPDEDIKRPDDDTRPEFNSPPVPPPLPPVQGQPYVPYMPQYVPYQQYQNMHKFPGFQT